MGDKIFEKLQNVEWEERRRKKSLPFKRSCKSGGPSRQPACLKPFVYTRVSQHVCRLLLNNMTPYALADSRQEHEDPEVAELETPMMWRFPEVLPAGTFPAPQNDALSRIPFARSRGKAFRPKFSRSSLEDQPSRPEFYKAFRRDSSVVGS